MAPRKHPLHDLIPEQRYAPQADGGDYVSRTIHGVLDMDMMEYANDVGMNVMIYGDTGPGKTSCVQAYAAKQGLPLVTVMCNGGVDPNTFWVYPVPDPEEGFKMIPTDVLQVIKHGGVLYLDELNFLPPKTTASFNSVLDGRRYVNVMELGNQRIHAHEDLLIVASFNPKYQGTRPLNEALMNRFGIKLEFDYDAKVERALVCMPVVLEIASKLRHARSQGTLVTPVSTNMLIEFEVHTLNVGLGFAIDNFCAAFQPEERPAVKDVFELQMQNLEVQEKTMIAQAKMMDEEDG